MTGVKEGLEDKIDAAKTKERRDRGPEKALEHKIPPKKKKKSTLQLPQVNGLQIRSYKLSILKVCIELCSGGQNYRIAMETDLYNLCTLPWTLYTIYNMSAQKSSALF